MPTWAQIKPILDKLWYAGGFTFGGTSRDLLRQEMPSDLDVYLPTPEAKSAFQIAGAQYHKRPTAFGPEYYDYRLTIEDLSIDVKTNFVSVTDCDINLILIGQTELKILYTPEIYIFHPCPLIEVLRNIQLKQFHPLSECPEHQKYRWLEFEKRGWKNLNQSTYA